MKRKGKHLVLVDPTKTKTPGKDVVDRLKDLGLDKKIEDDRKRSN